MAEYIRVDMDPAAIQALFSDWSSPVGLYIADLTQRAEDTAKIIAPVSPRGSKYAPPGYLRSRIAGTTEHYAKNGYVLGLVGIPLRAGSRYPNPFINNPKGQTRNANQFGHYGYRRASNRFLQYALNSISNG